MLLIQHHPWIIAVALALALAEYAWRRRTARGYDGRAALASFGVAIVHALLRPLNLLAVTAVLSLVARLAPVHGSMADWRLWVFGFFAVELAYYWFHRWSHEIAWIWATHAVHHSAREMVLPAAIRLGWTEFFSLAWVAFVPLALIGLPPKMIAILLAVNLLYQYLLHTEAPLNLGPLEAVLNTPAHHRVHHSRDAAFLDCNYGGMLIVFDRLFGTFRAAAPGTVLAYGLVHDDGAPGVLGIGLGPWRALFARMAAAHGWRARLAVALGRP